MVTTIAQGKTVGAVLRQADAVPPAAAVDHEVGTPLAVAGPSRTAARPRTVPTPRCRESSARSGPVARIVSQQQRLWPRVAVPSSSDPHSDPRLNGRPHRSPTPAGGAAARRIARLSWIRIAISLVALAGVVWWASRREPPKLPSTAELAALLTAIALYALATVVRAERWQRLLEDEAARPSGRPTLLTCVGYMGNNVLPARAGDAIRMVLMAPRAHTSKRTVIGTLLAERLLDIAVLVAIFVIVGYGLLGEVGADSVEIILLAVAGRDRHRHRLSGGAAQRPHDGVHGADRVRHPRAPARPSRAAVSG